MSKLIGTYPNGSYFVELYQDGTKIRSSIIDKFIPAFAESCDVTITKKCDGKCPFCYADCTPDGEHAELLNHKFLDTLHPFTEMAINGNDLSHPQLEEFLNLLKSKKVVANITVNQKHFLKHWEKLVDWQEKGLFAGLGISFNSSPRSDFIEKVMLFPNAVIHTINGILTETDVKFLADKGLKLLILGYKTKGRGQRNLDEHSKEIMENMDTLKRLLPEMFKQFEVVSFDNLALEQLDVKSILDQDTWDEVYMGDEGAYTFYIDLVKGTFARSSLDTEEFPILNSIDRMFQFIRDKYHGNRGDKIA